MCREMIDEQHRQGPCSHGAYILVGEDRHTQRSNFEDREQRRGGGDTALVVI